MARNIEIKAKVNDLEKQTAKVKLLCDSGPHQLYQEDTFFHVPSGRLKLREFGDGSGELIQYNRPDSAVPVPSDYFIYPTKNPVVLKEVLTNALSVRAVVRKNRDVYMIGQTRIHFDRVEGLGRFIELEVVLKRDGDTDTGMIIAENLMKQLYIKEYDLITSVYVDLLELINN